MFQLRSRILMSLCICSGLATAADNPFQGKWKIDAPKSSWSDGKFPKDMSLVINMSFTGDQIKYYSVNDTNKNKQPSIVDFTAKMDWIPHPFEGSSRYNQVALRSLGKTQMEVLELKDGDVIVGAIYDLLPGGNRFARRGIAKGADGKSHEYEEFFDKQ